MLITVQQIQEDITKKFSLLNGNAEMIMVYIIELGRNMPAMDPAAHVQANLVKGCHSKVWLTASLEHNKVHFFGDSNTAITRGLISILFRILNGQHIKTILETDLYFMQKNRLDRFIGTQRSNGFSAIHRQMKYLASSFDLDGYNSRSKPF